MQQPHTPESFLSIFNWTPERRPLDIRVLDEQPQDGCTRQLIEYTIEEERIQAFLLLPPQQKEKAPGILAIHQDGDVRPYRYGKSEVAGLGGDPELKYGIELCQRGYVVICPDRFPFESRSLANSRFKETFDKFRIFLRLENGKEIELTEDLYAGCWGNRLQMEGKSPLRLELYEFQRTIDILCAHPAVDAERIGVIGHSAGGFWGAHLMFIDPRIKVGCSSCGVWLKRLVINQDALRPINGFGGTEPGIRKWGDLDDILAGIAPRPFLETRGDPGTPEEMAELTQKARARYAELGVAERFEYVSYDGGHTFRQDMREKSYAWFDRWFSFRRT